MSKLYDIVFRRTSTMTLAVITGAFFFERTIDVFADTIFETVNKGVRIT